MEGSIVSQVHLEKELSQLAQVQSNKELKSLSRLCKTKTWLLRDQVLGNQLLKGFHLLQALSIENQPMKMLVLSSLTLSRLRT